MDGRTDPQQIITALNFIDQSSFKTDIDRYAAKEAVRRLLARLKTPFERAWTLGFETPVLVAGLQIDSDLGIWTKWVETEGQNAQEPVKLEDIFGWCNAKVEPSLLRKFFRGRSTRRF